MNTGRMRAYTERNRVSPCKRGHVLDTAVTYLMEADLNELSFVDGKYEFGLGNAVYAHDCGRSVRV